jgi:hypothetical protein
MPKPQIYVSVDIEADGPIPFKNSMRSLGAAAFRLTPEGPNKYEQISTFKVNLLPFPGAVQDPDTMAWWAKQDPEVFKAATENAVTPEEGMRAFRAWLEGSPGKLTFMGYPATYDFMFTYFYLVYFTGFPTPFGFAGLDLKTLAMAKMNADGPFVDFREVTKKNMPTRWFKDAPAHTHDALDDAIGQGIMGMNMLTEKP